MGSITWLGHAAFEVKSAGKTILIDPWLTENPKATRKEAEVKQADLILITHDHFDHGIADGISIAKRTGASLVGIYELTSHAGSQGVKDAIGMNIGGTADIKGVTITMTQALHSTDKGNPVGFVFDTGETQIYNPGDTGIFLDMGLIAELYQPKITLIPIGGWFTMGPKEAAHATTLIKSKVYIPAHYGTFPVLAPNATEFVSLTKKKSPTAEVRVLNPGDTYEFQKG